MRHYQCHFKIKMKHRRLEGKSDWSPMKLRFRIFKKEKVSHSCNLKTHGEHFGSKQSIKINVTIFGWSSFVCILTWTDGQPDRQTKITTYRAFSQLKTLIIDRAAIETLNT